MPGDHHGFQRDPVDLAHPFGFAFQLAAGGEDVAAPGGADGGCVAGFVDEVGELFDLLPRRALVVGAGPWVERDQVDLGRNALEALDQPLASSSESLTPFSITYSNVMRRALETPG